MMDLLLIRCKQKIAANRNTPKNLLHLLDVFTKFNGSQQEEKTVFYESSGFITTNG